MTMSDKSSASAKVELTPEASSPADHGFNSWLNSDDDSSQYGTFQPLLGVKEIDSEVSQGNVTEKFLKHHTNVFIYCSHFLSAWGDRMWSFGVGLFLVRIAGSDLLLPGTYGLASGLAVFLLGALVGDWVDNTPRLKAAQLSLVLQNVLVVVCAVIVYLYIRYEADITGFPGGWAVPLYYAGIIVLAVLADLASMARVIAVERDWIVKICNKDNNMLANMTAILRRIDQTTLVLAPIATGQVMTYAGIENGALFIGAWNLASVVLEYYLMWKVYATVPGLAVKENGIDKETSLSQAASSYVHPLGSSRPVVVPEEASETDVMLGSVTPSWNKPSPSHYNDVVCSLVADTEILLNDSNDHTRRKSPYCCFRLLRQFIVLYEGWKTYMGYRVALAGLALAALYMTVLGFDNITVAYAVTQGVSESVLGLLMGAAAVFGMIGTFVYPVLHQKVGLVRTGLLALSVQLSCLLLCVISIWMPGSPFDPTFSRSAQSFVTNQTTIFTLASTPLTSFATVMESTSTHWSDTPTASSTVFFTYSSTGPSETSSPLFSSSLPDFSTSSTTLSTSLHYSTSSSLPDFSTSTTATSLSTSPDYSTSSVNLWSDTSGSSVNSISPISSSSSFGLSSPLSTVYTSTPAVMPSGLTTALISTSAPPISTSTNQPTPEAFSSLTSSTSEYTSFSSSLLSSSSSWWSDQPSSASSVPFSWMTFAPSSSTETPNQNGNEKSYVSVSFLMAGIVLARSGLWVADLAITQLFLETVAEKERGVVNGVQNSLNKLMEVLKFVLVVAIPSIETFGFLIILSFIFIFLGWLLYVSFVRKERGHLMHCAWCCCSNAGPTYVRV